MPTENSNQDITAVLAQIVSAVVGQFEMTRLLEQIIETTMQTLNTEICSIFLRKEDDPNKIICVAGSGLAKNIINKAEYKIGEGLTGGVAANGKYVVVQSKEELEKQKEGGHWLGKFENSQFEGSASEFRNLLAVPMKIKDKILGVIKVENKNNTLATKLA